MKRWSTRAAVVGFALAFSVAVAAPAAHAACTTQGQFALTLAQVIGLVGPGATQLAASEALVAKGVKPTAGWQLDTCLTDEAEAEIDAALQAAIKAGDIDQKYANAVMDATGLTAAAAGGTGGGVGAGGPEAGRVRNPPTTPVTPVSPFRP